MKRHFDVIGCFDHANKKQKATLTIDGDTDIVAVRLHRRHKVYEFSLTALAEIAYRRAVEQEVLEKRKPRRKMAKRGILSLTR